ncbi:hypothetical protein E4T47_07059 [Aureobasidium subglaciale]|nr:hypothetical protein E4T47_07059 [Aureobasidium subglaciale]
MEQQWTEEQYEAALAKLELLTDQVTALRTTIPAIISPLTRPATSKPAAFAGLKKAATGAVIGVQDLRREWLSDGVQEILKRGRESYEKDGDLEKASEVPVWGWVKEKDEGEQGEVKKENDVAG